MDIVLWIVSILVALVFVAAGVNHATRRDTPRPGMEWMLAVPTPLLTTIGILEILGGVGLILPRITGVAPWLTPLAASCLAVLMILAAVFHLRRRETQNAIVNGTTAVILIVLTVALVPVVAT